MGASRVSAVHVAAMPDPHHEHEEHVVLDRIHHAVVPDADAMQALASGKALRAGRPRILRKGENAGVHAAQYVTRSRWPASARQAPRSRSRTARIAARAR